MCLGIGWQCSWAERLSTASKLHQQTNILMSISLGLQDKGASTVDEVVKLISPDPLTFSGLFAVTAVLAPILEEFVFRGFLLASFTTFMPVPYAIGLSSVGFGLAHLSVKDLPELVALGVLLSLAYIRSRNLLTPILIHGLWNGTVLLVLYTVAAQSTS